MDGLVSRGDLLLVVSLNCLGLDLGLMSCRFGDQSSDLFALTKCS